MKILHTISSVDARYGGPIEGIKQLAAVSKALGDVVEIASLDSPDDHEARACPLPVYALGPGRFKYRYAPRFESWLRQNSRTYDVVVVNGIWQFHSLATWRALRRSGTPYVVFTHGMLGPWFKHRYPLKHLKKCLYWPWFEYRVLRDAGAVLFTCEEERLLARESFSRYSACERVVGYGTRRARGNAEIQREAFLSSFPQLRGKKLVLFLGRIHPIKGCDLALQAFARVLAADPDWHLVLAGPDQLRECERLERLAADLNLSNRVTWTGMIVGDKKFGALRCADVFLLPSHHENFGVAVAEALAYGVPTLISNKVNIWREVEADGAGIVAADSVEGICSLLRTWASMTDSDKSAMREAARKCFEARFEIRKAANSLKNTLLQVVDSSRTSDVKK